MLSAENNRVDMRFINENNHSSSLSNVYRDLMSSNKGTPIIIEYDSKKYPNYYNNPTNYHFVNRNNIRSQYQSMSPPIQNSSFPNSNLSSNVSKNFFRNYSQQDKNIIDSYNRNKSFDPSRKNMNRNNINKSSNNIFSYNNSNNINNNINVLNRKYFFDTITNFGKENYNKMNNNNEEENYGRNKYNYNISSYKPKLPSSTILNDDNKDNKFSNYNNENNNRRNNYNYNIGKNNSRYDNYFKNSNGNNNNKNSSSYDYNISKYSSGYDSYYKNSNSNINNKNNNSYDYNIPKYSNGYDSYYKNSNVNNNSKNNSSYDYNIPKYNNGYDSYFKNSNGNNNRRYNNFSIKNNDHDNNRSNQGFYSKSPEINNLRSYDSKNNLFPKKNIFDNDKYNPIRRSSNFEDSSKKLFKEYSLNNINNRNGYNNKKTYNIINYSSSTMAGTNGLGITKTNQDSFIIKIDKNNNNENVYTFGVFDGHGAEGHLVSQAIKKFFINNDLNFSTKTNICSFFSSLSEEINNSQYFDNIGSGSTVVLVHINPEKIISINCGDSRAILITKKKSIISLTRDHKPELPDEKQRIEASGGRIDKIFGMGPYRVWFKDEDIPGLAMSRSIGDKLAHKVGVSDEPEVKEFYDVDPLAVIVASDGVWEFMSNDEVKNIVMNYAYSKDANACAKNIVEKARHVWIDTGYAIDDITCVVGFFDD